MFWAVEAPATGATEGKFGVHLLDGETLDVVSSYRFDNELNVMFGANCGLQTDREGNLYFGVVISGATTLCKFPIRTPDRPMYLPFNGVNANADVWKMAYNGSSIFAAARDTEWFEVDLDSFTIANRGTGMPRPSNNMREFELFTYNKDQDLFIAIHGGYGVGALKYNGSDFELVGSWKPTSAAMESPHRLRGMCVDPSYNGVDVRWYHSNGTQVNKIWGAKLESTGMGNAGWVADNVTTGAAASSGYVAFPMYSNPDLRVDVSDLRHFGQTNEGELDPERNMRYPPTNMMAMALTSGNYESSQIEYGPNNWGSFPKFMLNNVDGWPRNGIPRTAAWDFNTRMIGATVGFSVITLKPEIRKSPPTFYKSSTVPQQESIATGLLLRNTATDLMMQGHME